MTERQKLPELVLLVDDDPMLRLLGREALQQQDLRVLEADNGRLAVRLFEEQEPDIVLLDVLMPEMNGFETCAELRSLPQGARTPILMITGLEDLDSIHRAYQVGATDFATKPVNWVVLGHRVRYMLRANRNLESRLRSEKRNQALLDAIPDLMFVVGRDGTFLDYKPASSIELDAAPSDLTGRKIHEVLPPEIAETCMERLTGAMQTGDPQMFEYSMTVGGTSREFEARMAMSGAEEALAIIRDVTERNRLEEEFRQSQKMEALGLMAGGVAHDFNNTLTVISFAASVLARKLPDKDPSHKRVESILNATKHAEQLTGQLLAFSKRQIFQPQVLHLNEVVEEISGLLKRIMGEDVVLTTDLESDLWPVTLDPTQVQQVLMNLAVNARDAMPSGGRIHIETRNTVGASRSAGSQEEVMLSVSDTGFGMDKETAERIFEPFFTTKNTGTGLGLSTVFGIVRQSNGAIRVESEPGHGTTFHICFPRSDRQPEEIAAGQEEGDLDAAGRETILVVENEEEIRTLVCELLQGLGYLVLSASNAKEALARVEGSQDPIHLLLTDVVMPVMGGRQLAQTLARMKPGLKVLYISGYPDDVMVRHGVTQTDCAILPKPFDPDALAAKVRQVLDRSA